MNDGRWYIWTVAVNGCQRFNSFACIYILQSFLIDSHYVQRDQVNNALWCGLVHGEATPEFMTKKATFDQYRDSIQENLVFPYLNWATSTPQQEQKLVDTESIGRATTWLFCLDWNMVENFILYRYVNGLLFENNKEKSRTKRIFPHFYILSQQLNFGIFTITSWKHIEIDQIICATVISF